jgi:hypothetical protein
LVPREWPIQTALRRNPNWELLADGAKTVLLRRRPRSPSAKF